MKHQIAAFGGALRAEFRMQLRRGAMWLTFGFLAICTLPFAGSLSDLLRLAPHASVLTALCRWSVLVNFVLLVGVAFFMADRLPRDHRTRVDEVLATVADSHTAWLTGKYLGSLGAALIPVTLWYAVGVLLLAATTGGSALAWGLVTYGAIILPGALFVGAFSLASPAVIGTPLYQFLFIGYWLWGNAFPPYPHFPIPTLSGTVLTPVGSAISVGLFHVPQFGLYHLSMMSGFASLIVLTFTPVAVLALLSRGLRWHAVR